MELQDKVVFISGGSRGIGAATAVAFARQGANVAINYRSHPEEAEQVASQAVKLGRKAIILRGDVADLATVESMVAETVQRLGRLDVAVSNAAYSDREKFHLADMDGFRRTIDVTMWGAFNVLRATSRQMIAQRKGGSIVVVSSPHAVVPVPGAMAYNMAKAAIDHMARTAAIELVEHAIRVNIVHPGWIDTPGERKFCSEKAIARGGEKIPWGRLGTSEEIARSIVFLASPLSDYMTGGTLTIDGGIQLSPRW